MNDQEKRSRRIEEERLAIRAICSTLVAAFGADVALAVLADERKELLQMKREAPAEPSEAFEQAMCSSGSIRATCDLCGRTYFVSHGDYDHGELEDLRQHAAKEPEKYIEEGRYDMIDVGYIEGKMVVLGCDCKKVAIYEQWIWNHRWMIAKYLQMRARDSELSARFDKEVAEQAQAGAAL